MEDILKDNINITDIDPDTLGGNFEIPDDLSEYEEDTNVSMAVAAINIGGGLTIVDNLTTVLSIWLADKAVPFIAHTLYMYTFPLFKNCWHFIPFLLS